MKSNKHSFTYIKKYLVICIVNLIYFGMFLFLLNYDIEKGAMFVGYSSLYALTFPIYGIIYGCVCFKKLGKILLFNLILFLISFIMQSLGIFLISNSEGIIAWSAITSLIIIIFSFVSGLITKFVLKNKVH